LDRASDFGSEGFEFESRRGYPSSELKTWSAGGQDAAPVRTEPPREPPPYTRANRSGQCSLAWQFAQSTTHLAISAWTRRTDQPPCASTDTSHSFASGSLWWKCRHAGCASPHRSQGCVSL